MRSLLAFSLLLTVLRHSAAQELVTVAISTFLLELTIQSRSRRDLLRGSSHRHLLQSADELIQSTAEQHLTRVYGELFRDPAQVLLTVVTTDSNNNEDGGFRVRSSFVGGVVSFSTEPRNNNTLEVPSR